MTIDKDNREIKCHSKIPQITYNTKNKLATKSKRREDPYISSLHVYINIYRFTPIHIHIHIYTYIHIHTYILTYINTYAYIYKYTYIYVYYLSPLLHPISLSSSFGIPALSSKSSSSS